MQLQWRHSAYEYAGANARLFNEILKVFVSSQAHEGQAEFRRPKEQVATLRPVIDFVEAKVAEIDHLRAVEGDAVEQAHGFAAKSRVDQLVEFLF